MALPLRVTAADQMEPLDWQRLNDAFAKMETARAGVYHYRRLSSIESVVRNRIRGKNAERRRKALLNAADDFKRDYYKAFRPPKFAVGGLERVDNPPGPENSWWWLTAQAVRAQEHVYRLYGQVGHEAAAMLKYVVAEDWGLGWYRRIYGLDRSPAETKLLKALAGVAAYYKYI